jgi:hypothetical protein
MFATSFDECVGGFGGEIWGKKKVEARVRTRVV